MSHGNDGDEVGGSFAYAPNTGAVFSGDDGVHPPQEPAYVRLMPDYGVDVPLWGLPWQHLDLEGPLVARLRAWQARFDEHFHHERGWDDTDIAREWRLEGDRLGAALRHALGHRIEVQVDLWPR